MRMSIALLGVIVIFFILNQSAPAQAQQRQCIPNQICVMPHDYLKYEYNDNFTRLITFGDFIDQSTIKVTNTGNDGKTITNDNYILNLKNGIWTDSNGTQSKFYPMIPIPVDSKNLGSSFAEESINFKGFKRDSFGMHIHNITNTENFIIDKETGITLSHDDLLSLASFGKPYSLSWYFKLLDTNMITTSNVQQNAIPEFGPLAGMIVVISLIGVIVASKIKFDFALIKKHGG